MALDIQIPERGKPGLAALLRLAPKSANQLRDVLEEVPPRLRTRDLSKRIAGKVDIPSEDLRAIVGVLVTLYAVREYEEVPVDEFVDALVNAIEQSADELLAPYRRSAGKYRSRLNMFLSLHNSLGLTAKALSVAYENVRHYHSCRILTDARPIFTADATQDPQAFVITHTLRVNVHEAGEDTEWFVSLNSVDLENLKNVIERAMVKEKSLTALLRTTNTTILEWEA